MVMIIQTLRCGRRLWGRKLVRIIVIILVIAVPAITWLNHWSSAPAATTIHVAQPASSTSAKPAYKALSTAYFSTEIPSDWQPRAAATVNGRIQQVAVAPPGVSGQLGLTSAVLPSDGLSGVADYKLRISDAATYNRLSDAALPAGSEIFQTAGSSDYTTFLIHNGRYAAISISGLESGSDAHNLLLHLLASWQWKNS